LNFVESWCKNERTKTSPDNSSITSSFDLTILLLYLSFLSLFIQHATALAILWVHLFHVQKVENCVWLSNGIFQMPIEKFSHVSVFTLIKNTIFDRLIRWDYWIRNWISCLHHCWISIVKRVLGWRRCWHCILSYYIMLDQTLIGWWYRFLMITPKTRLAKHWYLINDLFGSLKKSSKGEGEDELDWNILFINEF